MFTKRITKTEEVIGYAQAAGIFVGSMEVWKKAMSQQDKCVCARFWNDRATDKLEAKLWKIRNRYEAHQPQPEPTTPEETAF